VPCGQAAGTATTLPHGLAPPGDAGLALAAQAVSALGHRTAWARAAVLSGESGDEIGMKQSASTLPADVLAFDDKDGHMQSATRREDAITT